MTDSVNSTDAVIEQIDKLLQSENLTTRSGLTLVMSAFRGGMVFMSGVDKRIQEMEQAYIRFTNIQSEKKLLEEANSKAMEANAQAIKDLETAVRAIMPIANIVRWLGITVGGLVVVLIWSLITGQVVIVKP